MARLTAPVQLSPNLFIVFSEFPHIDSGNVYLITGQHPTLIDCGSQRAVAVILDNLKQLGLDIRDIEKIVATHGDYDHIQGYHHLKRLHPSLLLYIHRADWPSVQGNDSYRNASYLYPGSFVPILPEHCLALDDGDAIESGDTTLNVIHTPGHTEGSVTLGGEIDGHRVLFAGDAIGGAMRGLEGAAVPIWLQAIVTWRFSLQTLAALDFEWVLTGHEPADSLPITRNHFDRMVASFGKMMNPWFSLDQADEVPGVPSGLPILPLAMPAR